MEVAGRMGDAPSYGRFGKVIPGAHLSECRHDVHYLDEASAAALIISQSPVFHLQTAPVSLFL
jgi:hypothetical protein